MIFTAGKLNGAFLTEPSPIADERGFFARSFCKKEYLEHGIDFTAVQCNLSFNEKAGTLRGLHFQNEPFGEAKIVSCISGEIFDVIVDLRRDSDTRLCWDGFYLSAQNHRSLYIPKGFAHGFVTLADRSLLHYQMSEFYHKGSEGGIRYDDPTINIRWPYDGEFIISERDLAFGYIEGDNA